MGTRSTFQGIVRTYGGQYKEQGTTPAVLVASQVVSFTCSTTVATPLAIGSTASGGTGAGPNLVLPAGAIPLSFQVITAGSGATATADFGTIAGTTNVAASTSIGNEIVIGTTGIKVFNGTAVSASGLSANATVYSNVGATAGTGTVTGVFTWTFSDNAQDGVVGPASTGN
jgi:hypothetical protein